MDARRFGVRDYNRIYRVFGNIGAVGSAIMANRYQVAQNRVKTSLGSKGYSIQYPKKYKKQWEVVMAGKRSRGKFVPPTPPKRFRVVGNSNTARRAAMVAARRRHIASMQSGKMRLGKYTSKMLSPSNKYIQNKQSKSKQVARISTNAYYKGAFGKTNAKKAKIAKYLYKGVVVTREHSGEYTVGADSTETVYIGHATCPNEVLAKTMFKALLKNLFLKAGFEVKSLVTGQTGLAAGDIVNITYKNNYDSSAYLNYTYTVIGTDTIDLIATFFYQSFFVNVGYSDQAQLISIYYQPAAGNVLRPKFTQIHLKNAKVKFHCKSVMVIQNRTQAVTGNDGTEFVDSQPLRGVSYFGYGSGTQAFTNTNSQEELVATDTNGVILRDAGFANGLQEPPDRSNFTNVRKSGVENLDPGVVKTSVLTYEKYFSVNSVMKAISGALNVNNTYHRVGKFKFFAFEKMLNIDLSPRIRIAFEHNLQVGCTFYGGSDKYTEEEFIKTFLV